MKKSILACLLAAASIVRAQTTPEVRHVDPYKALRASGMIKIVLTEGQDATEITIKPGENESADNVEARVDKGVLILDSKDRQKSITTVEIHNRNLSGIELSGVCSFKSAVIIVADTLVLDAGGATDIRLSVTARKVDVTGGGAADIVLSGTAEILDAEAGGASSIKALDLAVTEADVNASGAATVKVNAEKKVKARATGASSIRVKGEPKEFRGESSGSASIRRLGQGNAQVSDSSNIRVTWDGKEIGGRRRDGDEGSKRKNYFSTGGRSFHHWAGLSLGVNGLVTGSGGFSQPASSPYKYLDLDYSRCINFQLNPFQFNFHIYRNYINVVTGLGFDWRRFVFENRTILDADSSFTWGWLDSTKGLKYNSSMLKSAWIQVPLMLDFNTNRKFRKSFHLTAGVIGQFLLSSKTKREMEFNGDEITVKHRDNFNINPFQLKAHASIGYGYVTVFGEYSLTQLFAPGKGPVVYPVTFGIRFLPFVY